jgi:hypothetical protein
MVFGAKPSSDQNLHTAISKAKAVSQLTIVKHFTLTRDILQLLTQVAAPLNLTSSVAFVLRILPFSPPCSTCVLALLKLGQQF